MSGLKKALDKFVDVYNHVLCFLALFFISHLWCAFWCR